MRILLDTHVFVWAHADPQKLGARCKKLLRSDSSEVFISAISALELAQLVFGRRLILSESTEAWLADALLALKAQSISVTNKIAVEAYSLPEPFHRDPADRIIVATSREMGLSLLTADRTLLKFEHCASIDALR